MAFVAQLHVEYPSNIRRCMPANNTGLGIFNLLKLLNVGGRWWTEAGPLFGPLKAETWVRFPQGALVGSQPLGAAPPVQSRPTRMSLSAVACPRLESVVHRRPAELDERCIPSLLEISCWTSAFSALVSQHPFVASTTQTNERNFIAELDSRAHLLNLDQVKLSPTGSAKANLEPCDFLSTHKQFIHLKDGHSSAPISHLWNQASLLPKRS